MPTRDKTVEQKEEDAYKKHDLKKQTKSPVATVGSKNSLERAMKPSRKRKRKTVNPLPLPDINFNSSLSICLMRSTPSLSS